MTDPTNGKCGLCGSSHVYRNRNAGWDVWEGGEEDQHIDKCYDCGATRLVSEGGDYEEDVEFRYGKWKKDVSD